MIDYSGTMNALGFNEVVYMCHPPDQNWCTGSSRITRPPLTTCRCINLLYEYTASNAYDISFPPLVHTGLSFHWTLPYWKIGFQFSSTDLMTARCNSCFVFIYVVSFVLLWSGYKSDNFWTNVRDNLTKASSGKGLVIISDIWSLVPISLNFIVPLTICCCK